MRRDAEMSTIPHPQSRASLLALRENLRQEALSRKRAMADIAEKREFERLRLAHGRRMHSVRTATDLIAVRGGEQPSV